MSLPMFESRIFSQEEGDLSHNVIIAAESLAVQIKAINPSRERSLAVTKLEEVVMWAHRAIAVQE